MGDEQTLALRRIANQVKREFVGTAASREQVKARLAELLTAEGFDLVEDVPPQEADRG